MPTGYTATIENGISLRQCYCKGWKEFVPLNGTHCRWCGCDLYIAESAPSTSTNTARDAIALLAKIHLANENGVSETEWESLMDQANAVVAQQHP